MDKYLVLKINDDFDKNDLEVTKIKYFMFRCDVENEVYCKEFIKINSFRMCYEEFINILANEHEEYLFVTNYTPEITEDFGRVDAMPYYLFETKQVTLKNIYQVINDAEICPNHFLYLKDKEMKLLIVEVICQIDGKKGLNLIEYDNLIKKHLKYMKYEEFEKKLLKGKNTYYIDDFVGVRNNSNDLQNVYNAIKLDKNNYKILLRDKMGMSRRSVYFINYDVDDYKYVIEIHANSYTPIKESNYDTNRYKYFDGFNAKDYMGKPKGSIITCQFGVEFLEKDIIKVKDIFKQVTGEDVRNLYPKWSEYSDEEYIKKIFSNSKELPTEKISKCYKSGYYNFFTF